MDKSITRIGLAMQEKLSALPSPERTSALVKMGDVVWLTIRANLRSRILRKAGDALWGLMKFDLRRPTPAPKAHRRFGLN